jgi:hypothetical protein
VSRITANVCSLLEEVMENEFDILRELTRSSAGNKKKTPTV